MSTRDQKMPHPLALNLHFCCVTTDLSATPRTQKKCQRLRENEKEMSVANPSLEKEEVPHHPGRF